MPKEIRNPKDEPLRYSFAARAESFCSTEESRDFQSLEDDPTAASKPSGLLKIDERTARFGEAIIRFVKKVPRGPNHPENNRLVDQLVGAGTSIGANYCEADDSVSGKDYKNKIGTCRKESKEAMFFLRMIAASEENLAEEFRRLWREAKELNLIFGSIWRK